MLSKRYLLNVFGGEQVLLSFLKMEVLCMLATGRTSSLVSAPLLILKCLSHCRTVEKIQRLKWDAVLQHSCFFPLLKKHYMRKLIQLLLKILKTGRNLAYLQNKILRHF